MVGDEVDGEYVGKVVVGDIVGIADGLTVGSEHIGAIKEFHLVKKQLGFGLALL